MDEAEIKTKRGRPAIILPGWGSIWPDITSRRGLLNKHYEVGAYDVIRKMQEEGITGLEFLRDPAKAKGLRWGILRELGRLDEETIRAYAPMICEAQSKPESRKTVRQWEHLLRIMRLNPEAFTETVSETGEAEQ